MTEPLPEDRRLVNKRQRRLAIGLDLGAIGLIGTCLFWVGQQSVIIENQGKQITELTEAVKNIPNDFVPTRAIDEYIARHMRTSSAVTRGELEALAADVSTTRAEVRENLELSLQMRIRDLHRESCGLAGVAKRTLETEVQDLQNRYVRFIGREYLPPRC